MSNNLHSILAGAFFDQLCEVGGSGDRIADIEPERLRGSMFNPLQAMRLLTMNAVTGDGYGSAALAEATGVPAKWFDAEHLNAPIEEVIPALGRMALIYLSSLRTVALVEGFKVDAKEDCLKAESTFAEVLTMNKNLVGFNAH